MQTMRILLISGLVLIGLLDVAAFTVIFLARPKYIVVGRLRWVGVQFLRAGD